MSSNASFLSRWSRLKLEAQQARAEAERAKASAAALTPVADAAPLGEPAAASALELPPVESLAGLESDYSAFMDARVDADTQRAALKKLFADPHFNEMDGLDIYIDDYTQFEPLPTATRLMLASAQDFLLDSERAAIAQAQAETAAAQAAIAAAAPAADPTPAGAAEPAAPKLANEPDLA